MLKYLIKVIIRNLLKIFWIFPVNQKKIYLQSFTGLKITCNPLYIFNYLYEIHSEYKYVWLVNKIPEEKKKNVVYVKIGTVRWIYEILTSKVLITNDGFFSYLPYRRKTVLIETWHGGGAYKRVGAALTTEKNDVNDFKSLLYMAKHLDYFISSSKKFSEIMSESRLVDIQKFLPVGMPRNDILFDSEKSNKINEEIRKRLGFSKDDFVVLYAPTFRGKTSNSHFDNYLDVKALKSILTEKIGKNTKVLFRGHYLLCNLPEFTDYDKDVSDWQDMQMLLVASDMMITDYSSCMWDYSLLKRPCFLFVPDFDEYVNNRGFYTDPVTWGFPICRTNTELKEKIISFDKKKYVLAVENHHKNLASYENGTATERIAKIILEATEK